MTEKHIVRKCSISKHIRTTPIKNSTDPLFSSFSSYEIIEMNEFFTIKRIALFIFEIFLNIYIYFLFSNNNAAHLN
jgi:hypothetical protein